VPFKWVTLKFSYTVCEYDERVRIKYMKLYPPVKHPEELVITVFPYTGGSNAPSRMEVNSLIEKKVRRTPSGDR